MQPTPLPRAVIWIGFALLLVAIAAALFWPMDDNEQQQQQQPKKENEGIAVVSMMKDPKNIDTWLSRHRESGIQHFFIRLEDSEDPDILEFLTLQDDVTMQSGESTGVNEYDDKQRRQDMWVEEALKMASDDPRLQWMIHIDSDEIVVGKLGVLKDLPPTVRTVWFQNVEAKFTDIPTLEDSCFDASRFVNCATKPGECAAYGNGKSAGRVASDVKPFGPHRFKSTRPDAKEEKVDDILVEHYESCDFNLYKKKFQGLAVQDKKSNIPFAYYNESIAAAKQGDDDQLEAVYRKYRVDS